MGDFHAGAQADYARGVVPVDVQRAGSRGQRANDVRIVEAQDVVFTGERDVPVHRGRGDGNFSAGSGGIKSEISFHELAVGNFQLAGTVNRCVADFRIVAVHAVQFQRSRNLRHAGENGTVQRCRSPVRDDERSRLDIAGDRRSRERQFFRRAQLNGTRFRFRQTVQRNVFAADGTGSVRDRVFDRDVAAVGRQIAAVQRQVFHGNVRVGRQIAVQRQIVFHRDLDAGNGEVLLRRDQSTTDGNRVCSGIVRRVEHGGFIDRKVRNGNFVFRHCQRAAVQRQRTVVAGDRAAKHHGSSVVHGNLLAAAVDKLNAVFADDEHAARKRNAGVEFHIVERNIRGAPAHIDRDEAGNFCRRSDERGTVHRQIATPVERDIGNRRGRAVRQAESLARGEHGTLRVFGVAGNRKGRVVELRVPEVAQTAIFGGVVAHDVRYRQLAVGDRRVVADIDL